MLEFQRHRLCFQMQVSILAHGDAYVPSPFEAAEEQFLGQWTLDVFLDDTCHRPGTHLGIVAALGNPSASLSYNFV